MLAFVSLAAVLGFARAADFPFDGDRALNPATRDAEIQSLARAYLASYHDDDEATNLDNRFRFEADAGDYEAAAKDLEALRALPARHTSPFTESYDVQYLVDIEARAAANGKPAEEDLRKAFQAVVEPLEDKVACLVVRTMKWTKPEGLGRSVQAGLDDCKGKKTIGSDNAYALLRNDFAYNAFKDLAPVTDKLVAEDDARRYVTEKDVLVKTPDGATVCATIVRPKNAKPLPALLEYTIYNGDSVPDDARFSAGFGYVGVVGLTRGKGTSPDKPWPYVHDGADASALIDWLCRQPWCDGRVGMVSGSYNGFTQWATAKHMPKGLKAMFDSASGCPGIDVPMEGNVIWNFIYAWPFYTTDNKTLDNEVYGQRDRWQKLDRQYYLTGRPYKDLDKIDGTPNPIFDEWISHPVYDSYWRNMVPYKNEFAKIDIPILTTAGYFYGGPGACAYYYREHTKYNPNAEHYLVIGPWDHFDAQIGVFSLLGRAYTNFGGYDIDPVAKLNLEDLRYQWFDYVFKGGAKPDLLKDKVNYQLTGANEWRHAPSLAGMSSSSMRLYLSKESPPLSEGRGQGERFRNPRQTQTAMFIKGGPSSPGQTAGGGEAALARTSQAPASHSLSATPSAGETTLTVDLANRKDVDDPSGGEILSDKLVAPNALVFTGEPLAETTDVAGFLSGELDFTTNKRDFDVSMRLYDLRPDGKYFQVGEYWCRASSMEDLTKRKLLTPGKQTRLHFQAIRLMGHRCEKGSRLVLTIGVIKEVGREINYGSGKTVTEESIADAKEPVEIKWHGDSYVDVPVTR